MKAITISVHGATLSVRPYRNDNYKVTLSTSAQLNESAAKSLILKVINSDDNEAVRIISDFITNDY